MQANCVDVKLMIQRMLISAYVDLTHEVANLRQFAQTGGHVTYQLAPAGITNDNEG